MANDKINIKEGTTSPISMQALADGNPIDLTPASFVRLSMIDNLRGVYQYNTNDTSPYIVITNASQGILEFTPPNQTIFRATKSPYRIVIWVYSSFGARYACPESGVDIIIVQPEF